MSGGFPTGYYIIRPVDVPEGYNLSRGTAISDVEGPVTVDDTREVWQVIGENDSFRFIGGLGKPGPGQPKWVTKPDNVLFFTSQGAADNYRIERAGDGVWVIGIPGQDLLLTYDAGAKYQLTFRPADGSRAQRFLFLHPA